MNICQQQTNIIDDGEKFRKLCCYWSDIGILVMKGRNRTEGVIKPFKKFEANFSVLVNIP